MSVGLLKPKPIPIPGLTFIPIFVPAFIPIPDIPEYIANVSMSMSIPEPMLVSIPSAPDAPTPTPIGPKSYSQPNMSPLGACTEPGTGPGTGREAKVDGEVEECNRTPGEVCTLAEVGDIGDGGDTLECEVEVVE